MYTGSGTPRTAPGCQLNAVEVLEGGASTVERDAPCERGDARAGHGDIAQMLVMSALIENAPRGEGREIEADVGGSLMKARSGLEKPTARL